MKIAAAVPKIKTNKQNKTNKNKTNESKSEGSCYNET